ncbi:MAG: VRR-NUC domain-containing protein [Sneathiella sp.]
MIKLPIRRKYRNHAEYVLQCNVVKFLHSALPKDCVFFHVPNGEERNLQAAIRLKKAGVLAGIPDLVFVYRGTVIFIEMKAGKGPMTESQKREFPRLEYAGFPVSICKSIAEVEDVLRPIIPLRASTTVRG